MDGYPILMGRRTAHSLGLTHGGYAERGFLISEGVWIPESEFETAELVEENPRSIQKEGFTYSESIS